MRPNNKKDLNLQLGNLILAIALSTVPTAITYGVLGLHGINVCNSLQSKIEEKSKDDLIPLCKDASWETTKQYILLIGFFITLPTWMWFYISVKKKQSL